MKLNLPNCLSFLRLLIGPGAAWLVIHNYPFSALGVVILAIITDIADGWIARKWHMASPLGKILDPLADKFFVSCLFFALTWIHKIPLWVVIFIVLREFILVGGGIILWKKHHEILTPNWISKLNTFLQCCIGIMALLSWPFEIPLAMMVGTTIFSTLIYGYQGWHFAFRD